MAHNSTENLIQSDSSTSTDEINNGSHSRSVEKVSKKMFYKKKTAFVGANSVTSPSSSVTSSPQQHPIIVVGTADVHQPRLSPPQPLPRKKFMTPADSMESNRKYVAKVDDVLDISLSESNNSEGMANVTNREDIELTEIKSQSESSGPHTDRTEEPKMFFARSRKNTIVTNIDEVSIKSSGRTQKSSQNESKSQMELKPLPKPRQYIQPQYEIVQEKPLKKKRTFRIHSSSESEQSKSFNSGSETFTKSEFSDFKENKPTKEERKPQIDEGITRKDNMADRLIGKIDTNVWFT